VSAWDADLDNSLAVVAVDCCDDEVLLNFGCGVGDEAMDWEKGEIVAKLVGGGALYWGGVQGDVKNWRLASTIVCLLLELVTTFCPEIVTQVADLKTFDCFGEFSIKISLSSGSGPKISFA
jgi:hypothetical protein